MGRLDRFGRLEGPREGRSAPRPEPSVEGRFRPAPPAAPEPAPGAPRSGGQPGRFEAGETAPRVLDLGEGQGFVRCADCRQDHHATAVRCTECGADLTTRVQRDFNQALWKRQLDEKAEQDAELARMRESREEADRAQEEVLRQWKAYTEDMRNRRGLFGVDDGDELAPVRAAGHAIGRWLRQVVPDRTHRLLVLGVLGAGFLGFLYWLFGRMGAGELTEYVMVFGLFAGIGLLVRLYRSV
jgi:hypothetical protein